jgi:hypothetical protein
VCFFDGLSLKFTVPFSAVEMNKKSFLLSRMQRGQTHSMQVKDHSTRKRNDVFIDYFTSFFFFLSETQYLARNPIKKTQR